jgi:catechol 2,3-dioxygenase-like lactoylglutathione lyase family enzyme
MNIIDHLSIGVPDLKHAATFYDGLMETLGCKRLATSDRFAAYGKDTVQFLLMLPADGQLFTKGNGTHICFRANTKDSVDAFHVFAIANGGRCDGQPDSRPDYPIPNVYAAFIRDPFGHKLEVIFNGFSTY